MLFAYQVGPKAAMIGDLPRVATRSFVDVEVNLGGDWQLRHVRNSSWAGGREGTL